MWSRRTLPADNEAQNAANRSLLRMVDETQAVIWFRPDSTIFQANANFLSAMGYRAEEIIGQKHAIFVDADFAASAAYAQFWSALRSGRIFTERIRRLRKGGKPIYLQATYSPVYDDARQLTGVVKIAVDVTAQQTAIEVLGEGCPVCPQVI